MSIVCFHNPDEDNGFMSNWYLSRLVVDDIAFSSVEQFMMYRKAVCFCDEPAAEQILATDDVARIKTLGRLVSNYDEGLWNGVRQIVVYEGLLAKFMGKKRLIAETGAGQHGVALATAAAFFGLECEIHMGEVDIAKQAPNVTRMKILGAKVVPVTHEIGRAHV